MKRLAAVVAVALMTTACGSDSPTTPSGSGNTGPITFTVQMSAANETPPITNADANGRGTATITFTVPRDSTGAIIGGGTVRFQAQLSGFPGGTVVRNAHIHTGASGIPGAVLVDTLLTPAAPITLDASGAGTMDLTNSSLQQTDATNIAANPAGYYFNVHTAVNPGGAVRGQLVKQ
jgi:hypothetical protein